MQNPELEPEFHRPLPLARIPETGVVEKIIADSNECTALAKRMKIPAIASFSAELSIEPWKRGGVRVRGQISATIEQICVITLEPFKSNIKVECERFFIAGSGATRGKVLILDVADEQDPDLINGDAIDLGEIAAESLALDLESYPKRPGAVFSAENDEKPNHVAAPRRNNPFSVLEKLKNNK